MSKSPDPNDRQRAGNPPDVDADFENGDEVPHADPADGKAGRRKAPGAKAGRGPSRASDAVALALDAGAELWHDPDGEAYADLPQHGARATLRVRSTRFRDWLSGLAYKRDGGALGGQAATDALSVLAAKALHDGPERTLHVRVALGPDGALYLDIGDPTWRAVRVTGDGWTLDPRPPVRFRRPNGMRPLPEPVRRDGLAELRNLVRPASDRDWRLIVGWLVGTFHPEGGPYPLLALAGEHGSGKTWTARTLRACVDPSTAELRSPPREPRDLVVGARHSHILAYDNLSSIPAELSDGFCRIATGGGYGARQLHTDGDEVVYADRRPILLTSIEDVATRADLADRAIMVTLDPLPEVERRTESDLLARRNYARPAILAALLDAVAMGLRCRADVHLDRLPRMADFAAWVVACEPALPWKPGEWLTDYTEARADGQRVAFDADPVAQPVSRLVAASRDGKWEGTAGDLLDALNAQRAALDTERADLPHGWPTSSRGMAGKLRRAAPLLRADGVSVMHSTGPSPAKRRLIHLGRVTE